jgi:hypothetical protein
LLLDETPANQPFPTGEGLLFRAIFFQWRELVDLLLDRGWTGLPACPEHFSPVGLAAGLLNDEGLVRRLMETAPRPAPEAIEAEKTWINRVAIGMQEAIGHDNLEIITFFRTLRTWNPQWTVSHAHTGQAVRAALSNDKLPPDSRVLIEAVKNGRSLEVVMALHEGGAPLAAPKEHYPAKTDHALSFATSNPALFGWLLTTGGTPFVPGVLHDLLACHADETVSDHDLEMFESLLSAGFDLSREVEHIALMGNRVIEPLAYSLLYDFFLLKNGSCCDPVLTPGLVARVLSNRVLQDTLVEHPFFSRLARTEPWYLNAELFQATDQAQPEFPGIRDPDMDGNTALHHLAMGSKEWYPRLYSYHGESGDGIYRVFFGIDSLVSRGTNPDAINAEGKTASAIALENGATLISIYLLSLETRPDQRVMQTLFATEPDLYRQTHSKNLSRLVSRLDKEILDSGTKTLLHEVCRLKSGPHPDLVCALCNIIPVNAATHFSSTTPQGDTALALVLERVTMATICNDPTWTIAALALLEQGADASLIPGGWGDGFSKIRQPPQTFENFHLALLDRLESALEKSRLEHGLDEGATIFPDPSRRL